MFPSPATRRWSAVGHVKVLTRVVRTRIDDELAAVFAQYDLAQHPCGGVAGPAGTTA
jgi:hypothetical protein